MGWQTDTGEICKEDPVVCLVSENAQTRRSMEVVQILPSRLANCSKNDVISFEANMKNTWPGVLFTEQARKYLSKQVKRRKMVAGEDASGISSDRAHSS
jgi:hypothetical protein